MPPRSFDPQRIAPLLPPSCLTPPHADNSLVAWATPRAGSELSHHCEKPMNDGPVANVQELSTQESVTFQETFCARYHCPASEFPERAFRLCLFSHAIPLALVLCRVAPPFFREDRRLIEQLGLDQNMEEVGASLSDFQYVNRARPHWLRTGLKIRLSGRKVRELATTVLEAKDERLRDPSAGRPPT